MISCTEFIPAYSELFTYLDDRYGREEVSRLWEYLFAPTADGIPLINYAKKDGLRGCWNYWAQTLTEEAADVTCYMNEKEGWIHSEMHYCPSKGRLLALKDEMGIVPYYDYCAHCDYYRSALDAVGLKWIRNHIHTEQASCSCILYDPVKFRGILTNSDDTEVLEIKASEQEYFHMDFHSSMNMGLQFLGEQHGEQAVREYLHQYADHIYYANKVKINQNPLQTLAEIIQNTYHAEKASDAVQVSLTEKELYIQVRFCPAVRHLLETGRSVSAWFHLTTEAVMEYLAEKSGCEFYMESYEPKTGAAQYRFCLGQQ